jgi:hypothetical protein
MCVTKSNETKQKGIYIMKNRLTPELLECLNNMDDNIHPIITMAKSLRNDPIWMLSEQSIERNEEKKRKGERTTEPPSLNDLPELPVTPVMAQCAALGIETWCVPKKLALGSNFTSAQFFKAPHSEFVSIWLYLTFKFKWERCSSWFCDCNNFVCLDRITSRDYFIYNLYNNLSSDSKNSDPEKSGNSDSEKPVNSEFPGEPELKNVFNFDRNFITRNPNYPWIGYITTSYKKHGVINCKLNKQGQNIWLFENRLVDASDNEKTLCWWVTLNYYLKLGFSRSILESLNCPPFLIQKLGFKNWTALHSWAQDKYKSALYSLLLYFLPSQEEMKKQEVKR